MRIALVSEHASPLATVAGVDCGGQNVYVAALAANLVRLGHAVTVYTRRDDRTAPHSLVAADGYVVRPIEAGPCKPIPKDAVYAHVPQLGAALRRIWSDEPPDVVHSHFWMSGLAALAAAKPLGIPVVQTFHALGSEKRRHQGARDTSPAERMAEEQRVARSADAIIATANAEVFELLRMGAQPRDVRVVPCGVDLERFSPDGPREPRDARRARIVTLSRLVPRKGVATVIEALPSIPTAELIVAGGGSSAALAGDPEAQRLAALANALGVGERVHFRGPVERDAVAALLRSADVVACTPWYEPFGMVALEAMACGVPVLASNVGGLVDTVVDGLTGMLVPPRAPAHVARAVNAIVLRPAQRRAMASAAFERARTHYSWLSVTQRIVAVYRGLARDSAGGLAASG